MRAGESRTRQPCRFLLPFGSFATTDSADYTALTGAMVFLLPFGSFRGFAIGVGVGFVVGFIAFYSLLGVSSAKEACG